MNIIKFKDLISENQWFNDNLKGKYAWWILTKYASPFDHVSQGQYLSYERGEETITPGGTTGDEWPFIDTTLNEWGSFIDKDETEKINSISQYTLYNNYTTDDDITIDELKEFRTWLASTILSFEELTFGDDVKHMLEYYSNGMYDDTLKWLTEFGKITYNTVLSNNYQKTGCGCSGVGQNISSLYSSSLDVCDPTTIYRKNIWKLMVETFGDIDFWKQFSNPFLSEFKKYIDNILKVGLPLVSSEWDNVFADCVCAQSPGETNKNILVNLSVSLGYMIDEETGHNNFIQKSLVDWASILYEKMYWA